MSRAAHASAGSRLRRIEATLLASRLRQSSAGEPSALVLSCIRDYFAGVDVGTIADKMKRGGMDRELIRYYTEDIFAQAQAELIEWQEQMDAQILGIPNEPPC